MSRRRVGGWLLAGLVLVGAGLLAAWQARERLLDQLIERAVASSEGRLAIDRVPGGVLADARVRRLQWCDPQGLHVDLHELHWRWHWSALLSGRLVVSELSAAQVQIRLGAGGGPLLAPVSLALPLPIALPVVRIGLLRLEPAEGTPIVLRDLALGAQYTPGTDAVSGHYRIERLALRSPWGSATAGFELADRSPFHLAGRGSGRMDWQDLALTFAADGPLAQVQWQVQATAPGKTSPPAFLSAQGVLSPFASRLLGPVGWQVSGLTPAMLGLSRLHQGLIDGEGELNWRSDAPEQGISARVALRNRQPAPFDAGGVPFGQARATLRWAAGLWQIAGLQVHTAAAGGPGPGGPPTAAPAQLSGAIDIDPSRRVALPGISLPRLQADLQVSGLAARLLDSRLPPGVLSGRVRLDERTFELDLADRASAGLSVQAAGVLDPDRLVLSRLQAAAGAQLAGAQLQAQGAIQGVAPWAFGLTGTFTGIDIAAVQALAARWLPARTLPEPLTGALAGHWQLAGALRDPLAGLRIEGAVVIDRGSLQGQPLRASLSARVAQEHLERLALAVDVGANRLRVEGAAGRPGESLRYRLDAPAIGPLAALTGLGPLSGSMTAEGVWRGTWDRPELSIDASVAALRAPGVSVARAAVRGQLASDRASVRGQANDIIVAGRAVAQAVVQADGTPADHAIRLEVQLTRQQQLMARLEGGLAQTGVGEPAALRWQGTLQELALTGPLVARLRAPAALTLGASALRLGPARLTGAIGTIDLSRLEWQAGRWALVGEAALQRLASAAQALGLGSVALPPDVDPDAVQVALRADLSGTGARDIDGALRLQVTPPPGLTGALDADLRVRQGRLDGAIAFALPTLVLANRWIGPAWSVDGRLNLTARVSGTLAEPRLTGDVLGEALTLEQRALGWRLGAGTLVARFDGDRLSVTGLRLYSGQQAIDTAHALAPRPGADATAALPPGAIELTGTVALADRRGQFRLRATAARIPLGPGQRLVVSGDADVVSRAGLVELKGQLRADEGLIELRGGDAPALPDDVEIVSASGSGRAPANGVPAAAGPGAGTGSGAGAASAASLRLQSDLKIDLGEQLRVRGSGVDARLTGSVELRGSLPDAPRAYGTVRVRDGTYAAYGQQLQIERGRVVFNGALDNPVLDIVALRRNLPVEAGVALSGTVLAPRVRLTSRPDVVDAEKLSWLVLGVPLEGAQTGAQTAALQAAAASLFGGNDGGLARSLGVDLLTIRSASASDSFSSAPGLSGFTTGRPVPGQVVTAAGSAATAGAAQNVMAIGKRLNSRLLVTYEQGLRGVWNLLRIQYDMTRRLSLRAQTGSESAMDVLYRVSFD